MVVGRMTPSRRGASKAIYSGRPKEGSEIALYSEDSVLGGSDVVGGVGLDGALHRRG